MKQINVPDYAARDFCAPQSTMLNMERVYSLIDKALRQIGASDWVVEDMKFHSKVVNEPVGIERVENNFCVYEEQRGVKNALAIFHSLHLAAEYFVWKASKGQASIDWHT